MISTPISRRLMTNIILETYKIKSLHEYHRGVGKYEKSNNYLQQKLENMKCHPDPHTMHHSSGTTRI